MKTEKVVEFILDCLNEAEVDGYQHQEDDPIHENLITFYTSGPNIFIEVGDELFRCHVSKSKKAKGGRGRND